MITQLDWKPTTICGVAIWTSVTEDEGRRLHELAKDRTVLEVGSLFGYSTVCMASAAQRVVAVDVHDEGATDSASNSLDIMYRNLIDAGVANRVAIRVGWSHDVLPELQERHALFDGVFIDGNHSQEGCASDLALCWPMLRPGGFLAVHDYAYEPLPGVRAAVDTFVASYDVVYEGVTDTMWTGRRGAA